MEKSGIFWIQHARSGQGKGSTTRTEARGSINMKQPGEASYEGAKGSISREMDAKCRGRKKK